MKSIVLTIASAALVLTAAPSHAEDSTPVPGTIALPWDPTPVIYQKKPIHPPSIRWGFPVCVTEDSTAPCVWRAKVDGNGRGRSFVVRPNILCFVSEHRAEVLAQRWIVSER